MKQILGKYHGIILISYMSYVITSSAVASPIFNTQNSTTAAKTNSITIADSKSFEQKLSKLNQCFMSGKTSCDGTDMSNYYWSKDPKQSWQKQNQTSWSNSYQTSNPTNYTVSNTNNNNSDHNSINNPELTNPELTNKELNNTGSSNTNSGNNEQQTWATSSGIVLGSSDSNSTNNGGSAGFVIG